VSDKLKLLKSSTRFTSEDGSQSGRRMSRLSSGSLPQKNKDVRYNSQGAKKMWSDQDEEEKGDYYK
jgi:hypothetical protein